RRHLGECANRRTQDRRVLAQEIVVKERLDEGRRNHEPTRRCNQLRVGRRRLREWHDSDIAWKRVNRARDSQVLGRHCTPENTVVAEMSTRCTEDHYGFLKSAVASAPDRRPVNVKDSSHTRIVMRTLKGGGAAERMPKDPD